MAFFLFMLRTRHGVSLHLSIIIYCRVMPWHDPTIYAVYHHFPTLLTIVHNFCLYRVYNNHYNYIVFQYYRSKFDFIR